MLEAFDLPGSLRDAAELAACSHHPDPASPPRQTTVFGAAARLLTKRARALPWARRPQAAAVVAQLADRIAGGTRS